MSKVIETTERGELIVPADLVPTNGRKARYRVQTAGRALILIPEDNEAAHRASMTPEERIRDFREWANRPRPTSPDLPDSAFDRETIYP